MTDTPTIILADPKPLSGSETGQEIPFGPGVHPDKWKEHLVVVWVHVHRLVGLISDKSLEEAKMNEPFYLHQVCAWISQVALIPSPQQGTRVESVRAIVRYDNAGVPMAKLSVTQNQAVLRVMDQDKELVAWMITSYKAQALPSPIAITKEMPR